MDYGKTMRMYGNVDEYLAWQFLYKFISVNSLERTEDADSGIVYYTNADTGCSLEYSYNVDGTLSVCAYMGTPQYPEPIDDGSLTAFSELDSLLRGVSGNRM